MTKRERRPISAEDLAARLNTDPEFVTRRDRAEAEREAHAADWKRAEAPLVEALNAAGFTVDSAWDLVNRSDPYPEALPILVNHLRRPYPGRVREGIARALAVPQSRFAWNLLTRVYLDEKDRDAKDGLAVAIAAAADDDLIVDVIALARDKRNGSSRLLLLGALERSRDPRARAALMELGIDPELEKEVQVILRRLKRRGRRRAPANT